MASTFGYILILGSVIIFLASVILWLVAENRWSKRKRILLGVLAIFISLPVTILFTFAFTRLDDQSYYAASVRRLLDESVAALAAKEPDYLDRLKAFRDNQMLTYESRGNLLENVREFQNQGKALRQKTEKTEPGA